MYIWREYLAGFLIWLFGDPAKNAIIKSRDPDSLVAGLNRNLKSAKLVFWLKLPNLMPAKFPCY